MTLPAILTSETGKGLVETLAAEAGLAPELLHALLKATEDQAGKLRRKGLYQAFDQILGSSDH